MKKKLFFFIALLCSLTLSAETKLANADGPYGIMINGTEFHEAVLNPSPVDPSFTEYMALSVYVAQGATLQIYDQGNSAGFTGALDAASTPGISLSGDHYTCSTAGCYDFYIKLKWQSDQLYIGSGTGCSDDGNHGGGGQGGGTDVTGNILVKFFTPQGLSEWDYTATNYVWAWQTGSEGAWYPTTKVSDGCYSFSCASGTNLVFVNCNRWTQDDRKQTVDIMGITEAVCYTLANGTEIEGCEDYCWKKTVSVADCNSGTSTGEQGGGQGGGTTGGGTTGNRPDYSTSVPSRCPDVMLQAFYWDSNQSNAKHGDTRWSSLNAQASEIGAYFDLVWLPPSAKSSGGVGYLPSQYSNQNCAWGTRAELEQFITAMHSMNTKVIADIVVNHANNKSTWCDFWDLDFGSWGQFQPTAAWISRSDEVNSDSKAGACRGAATGAADTGYGSDANYGAARDWDHTNPQVQAMIKAYLNFLKHDIGYDGWRYDYCKGFNGRYVNMYNSAAKNYFSVTEYWDGNAGVLQNYLNDAGWNTLTFDFGTKYDAFNNGIAAGNYGGCRMSGLLGAGKSKYAVTFIDSHDSYQRDNNEFCGKGNSMNNQAKLLQANAFLLSMPGVPCVFYPHWKVLKSHIGPMILARKAAGIHSESAVTDEAGNGYYKATITGTNGSIKLFLGPNSGYNTTPAGYQLADKGANYAVYYQTTSAVAPQLIVEPGSTTFKDLNVGVTVSMRTIGGTGTAAIYYTLDGSDPTTSPSKLTYSAPISIKQTCTLKAYAESGGKKSTVQTYTYTYKAPQTSPITVKFLKPSSWAKVYLYAWTGAGATAAEKVRGDWPGTEMTNPDAQGWYSYTFDASIKEINFIFNAGNGGEQTGDLFTDEDVCYSWAGGSEKLEPTCGATGVENVESETFSIFPNPTQEILNLVSQAAIEQACIYSLTGAVCPMVVNNNQINVAALPNGLYLLQVKAVNGNTMTQRFIKQ